jgi:AraC family transcriptional regulator
MGSPASMIMDYQKRLARVTAYIGEHLDDEMTLEELSQVACFSKYHFHRLFKAYIGMPLHQYILWLRLKRAAHQLIVEKKRLILHIALDAGFDSAQAFARAFKKSCGHTPQAFRRLGSLEAWETVPFILPPTPNEVMMNVTMKHFPKIRLGVMTHLGDPQKLGQTAERLVSWAKAQRRDLGPKPGETFGIAPVDPAQVKPEDFRFDLGISLPDHLRCEGETKEMFLPEGTYAVTMYQGPRARIGEVVNALYQKWLPTSGKELGDFPCVFCYHNFDHEVAASEHLTEIRLLLTS